MAGWFVGPKMTKVINACFDYLVEQVGWQTVMKEELERLRENQPKIQAVVFAANEAQIISDQNPTLNKWIWQLRDALDDADDVLDEFEYMKHKEQLTTKLKSVKKIFDKICERALKRDPNLNRLVKAVQKLDKVSADVTIFLHLVDRTKQEQREQLRDSYVSRETGSLPKNDLIGRRKEKELVMNWLMNPSNEPRGTDLFRNIYLLFIVGHGGMGKTTLLQHVYKDEEITKKFDLKMWACVSNNFDVKKVIADMLESLKKERPRLDLLVEFQRLLKEEVMSKKFLLVLDDVWVEDEEKDISKWEAVLAPLFYGAFGSKILVTTRMDSVALMFDKVIRKKTEIVRLESLEEDDCFQLLNSHAFANVEMPPDDFKKLKDITGQIVKKLFGSPLAAKVIGGILNDRLDERHWREVLESNLLGLNSINSILKLSYIILPNLIQNCFAFCCMFSKDHKFYKDDLVRMWIALGFIEPFLGPTEDTGGRYFDDLLKRNFFVTVGDYYKMNDLMLESASKYFAQECGKLVDDEDSFLNLSETIRHLSIHTCSDILRRIEKFKHLHSLYLFYEGSNQDLYSALVEIFKVSKCLRILCIFAPCLTKIPEEIENLIHLRYLKISSQRFTMMPRSLSKLYHLQYIIHDSLGFPSQYEVDFLPSDITNLSNLRYLSTSPIVPMLRELTNLPPSLKSLSIWRCHPELKERYREDGGSDRHKIAHIPHIFFGGP